MAERGGRSRHDVEETISLLRQLVGSMDESESRLEDFYKEKDVDNFNKTKKFIVDIENKISEALR